MLLTELFCLNEGNIQIADIDRRARAAIEKSMRAFCEAQWNRFCANQPDLDPDDSEDRLRLFDAWDENYYHEHRDDFARLISAQASEVLTSLAAAIDQERIERLPPRSRHDGRYAVTVQVEIKEGSSDQWAGKYGGYHQKRAGPGSVIKIFSSAETVAYAGFNMMMEVVTGDSEGISNFVNKIVPIFIHEYTHAEQSRRGMYWGASRGYVSKTAAGKKSLYGDHHSPTRDAIGSMRYKSAAHEIEAFAAEAASEIIQGITTGWRHRQGGPDVSDINAALESIANGYQERGSINHYVDLRQYRDHYIEQGFSGKELDTVYKRFMKTLYRKIEQFKNAKIGRSGLIDAAKTPKDWLRYASNGLETTMRCLSSDLGDIMMDNPNRAYDLEGEMASFVQKYFYHDEWDYDRWAKVKSVLVRLARKHVADWNETLAA